MIKMIGFDLDGTIGDTLPMCIKSLQVALTPYVKKSLTPTEITNYFGINEVGIIKNIVGEKWEAALKDFYFHYEQLHEMCTAPFAEIINLLDELRAKNIPLVLITGKGKRSCDITLQKFKLANYFTGVFTGAEVGLNKSLNIADILRQHSLNQDEFYYIGDAVSDVTECHKVGVTCLSAAWATNAEIVALKKMNPQYVFEEIRDLQTFLNKAIT